MEKLGAGKGDEGGGVWRRRLLCSHPEVTADKGVWAQLPRTPGSVLAW